MFLYLTADNIGSPTGGGKVTYHESLALRELAEEMGQEFLCVSRQDLVRFLGETTEKEPWCWDRIAWYHFGTKVKLAHIYSGSFSQCVGKLKSCGAKVTYTVAAHDVDISREEHEKLGLSFDLPHLTDPVQWRRYSEGYWLADVLVCPGSVPKRTMERQYAKFDSYGAGLDFMIIPHGVDLPEIIKPSPKNFTVGYLGAVGPDKGLVYLLRAWKKLNYPDAVLVLAGSMTTNVWFQDLVAREGGGNIIIKGWVNDVSDFYNSLSLYVQPSATEGFGLEVLEAMAHGRPVVCSAGAGAMDVIPLGPNLEQFKAHARDDGDLADAIKSCESRPDLMLEVCQINRREAEKYTWDRIRGRYKTLWRGLL